MSSLENTKTVRVAFYIRVSTDEQVKEYWIDMQLQGLEDMMKYKADYFHWSHNKTDRYIDLWYSGSDLNRPEYKRMMEDAKGGKFDLVAVWKIDRLSRNLTHLLGTFESLQNNKVSFYSLKENVDFSGPIGKLTFQIFGALAEFERETIKTRTKEGKLASARLGNYILNWTPFGYYKPKTEARVNRTLVINEKEQVWVSKIFDKFLAGESLEGLARMMNENKVLKSSWNLRKNRITKWYPQSIKTDILENTVYVWRAVYNNTKDDGSKEIIFIKVPRIISDLDFEMVRHRMETVSRDAKRGGGSNVYLLSRKIVDIETGKKFIWVHRTKGGHSYRRKLIKINDKTYPNREIPWESIDKYVWDVVQGALNRPKELFELYSAQSLDWKDYERFSHERDIYSKKLEEEESVEIQIDEEYYQWGHSEEKRNILISRSKDRQKKLREDILVLDTKIDSIVEAQSTKEALESFTEKLHTKIEKLTDDQKQYLVNLLVERVEVTFIKSHPVVKIVLRFEQPSNNDWISLVEPKKSSNKPKMANWSSELSTMVQPTGIEPVTSSFAGMRSSSWATAAYSLYPFRRINTLFLLLQSFSFTNLLYPLTGSFELFLELSELFFCERFWTMCSGRETSFVHGQGDYRDYFLMASLNVKFTFLEKQHEKWAGVFLYRGGDSNSLCRRGRALSLGQTNYCLSHRPEPYQ